MGKESIIDLTNKLTGVHRATYYWRLYNNRPLGF